MFRIQIYEFISGWELCDCWTCAELCDSVFTSVCMWLSGLKPCPLFVPCSLLKQVLPTSTRSVPSFSKWSNMPALPFPITNALFRTTSSLLSIQVIGLFPLPHVYQQSTFVQIRFWDEISFPLVPSLANNFIAHSYHEHCQVFSHGAILFHEWLVCDCTPECFPSYHKTATISLCNFSGDRFNPRVYPSTLHAFPLNEVPTPLVLEGKVKSSSPELISLACSYHLFIFSTTF